MAKDSRVLFITQDIAPYVSETPISKTCRQLPQAIQELGRETRIFMPKWGNVNERRNQLHEVIRLSGMNLIIDDTDHLLIIKVASIPSARMQVYFIDNDDYFMKRQMMADENGVEYDDNDQRAVFFARGVLETVKKLRWQPDIVHCHGWFSDIVPLYLRYAFSDDPLYKDVKIVSSLYNDGFKEPFNPSFKETLANEGVDPKKLDIISTPSYENFIKLVIDNTDGIIVEQEGLQEKVKDYLKNYGGHIMWNTDKSDGNYLDNYHRFYEELLEK